MLDSSEPPDVDDEGSLVERSVTFLKEFSARLREGAGRKWQTTNLSLDIGLLRRRRRQAVLSLGEAAYAMMRRGGVEPDDLQEYFDEVRSLEQRIVDKEQDLVAIEEEEFDRAGEDEIPLAVPPARRRRSRVARRRGGEFPAGQGEPDADGWPSRGGRAADHPAAMEEEEPPPGVG